jgi:uncharacterized protein YjbI with pentapeptide repeats
MANPEHVELVRSGVEAVNRFASEHRDILLDLEGADLNGLDLREVRLNAANLAGANLEGADLSEARLNAVNMRNCNLRKANLTGATLHRAELTGADLREARIDAIGDGNQRMCIAPQSFEGVRWNRHDIERMVGVINLNPDWEIRYEIVPRGGD